MCSQVKQLMNRSIVGVTQNSTSQKYECIPLYLNANLIKMPLAKPPNNGNPITQDITDTSTWQSEMHRCQQPASKADMPETPAGISTVIKAEAPRNFAWSGENANYVTTLRDDYKAHVSERVSYLQSSIYI